MLIARLLLGTFVALESRPGIRCCIADPRDARGGPISRSDRNRGDVGAFLFLTTSAEHQGYTPIQTGLAFLPLPVVLVATAMTVQNALLNASGHDAMSSDCCSALAGWLGWRN